jgi:small-conductance mechanosensitive channel
VAWLQSSLFAAIEISLILLFGFLRGTTRNFLIKKRLGLSIILLSVAVVLEAIHAWYPLFTPPSRPGALPEAWATPQERLRTIELLLAAAAVISAGVALAFNRFRQETPSEKYPAIVQDALVIGFFVVTATFLWPEKLLTTSAMGAVILGFALQDTLGNLFAGLAIQIEKPFRVGDWIRSVEHEGLVLEVTWRATKIRTKAGNFVIIPNSQISKEKLLNYSQPTRLLRMEHTVGLNYDAPPNRVKQVVLETIASIPEIVREPAPDVLLSQYGDFAVNYRCRFWIENFAESDPILDKFTTLLYYRLKRAGLAIPFPVRDVRVTERRAEALLRDSSGDSRIQFVERVDIFEELTTADKELIAAAMEPITFASNETILRQGSPGDSMFFIRGGKVRILLETAGTSHEIAVLTDGQYFGEMALLTGEPRSATAMALGDVEAYVLRKDHFRDVLLQKPEIATEISRTMAERKEILEQKTAQVAAQASLQGNVQENLLRRIRKFFGL